MNANVQRIVYHGSNVAVPKPEIAFCTESALSHIAFRGSYKAAIEIDIAKSFDAWQLTGSFYEKKSGTTYSVTAQMNVFGQSWYFKATKVEDENNSWTLAYAEDASSADFTVTTKADGSAVAKGKIGSCSINATSFLATDGLKSGAFLADFVQFVTVSGKKSPLSIRANLWLDGSDAHDDGAGSARVEE